MKKYICALTLVTVLIGILGLGFIIKIVIIICSLFVHVFTHWLIEKAKFSKYRKINDLINILSANVINLIIGFLCLSFENEYIRYMALANFAICAINMIPVYPFDGRGVLDILVECIELETIKLKIYRIVDKGTRVLLLIVGIAQLILSVNHFSVLALYMMVTLFKGKESNKSL